MWRAFQKVNANMEELFAAARPAATPLRDQFAMKAMQGIIGNTDLLKQYASDGSAAIAAHAYEMADAMLAAREGK
ncbi:hypothetical protein [Cupriavidus gilardii]|uniref:hypothetical protein n=1 Tax=Cupriavidus gilardii TaxID=82541 RepID=UPI002B288EAF|nr:hypothetical protein QWJ31_19675 [Cupriavidus gilardii]